MGCLELGRMKLITLREITYALNMLPFAGVAFLRFIGEIEKVTPTAGEISMSETETWIPCRLLAKHRDCTH